MQKAVIADQMIIDDADTLQGNYADNKTLSLDEINFEKEQQRVIAHIQTLKKVEELDAFEATATANECYNEWALKREELLKSK